MEKDKKILQDKRRNMIKEIVKNDNTLTQEEITGKLKELGYNSQQGTICKDLKELGIVKPKGSKRYDLTREAQITELKKIAKNAEIKSKDVISDIKILIIKSKNMGHSYFLANHLTSMYKNIIIDIICHEDNIIIYYQDKIIDSLLFSADIKHILSNIK